MKYTIPAAIVALAASTAQAAGVQGFDISNHQDSVDFAAAYKSGARFVIIKATESTNFIDPKFPNYYKGATDAGFIRGGYHFAQPAESGGAEQADYFLAHGGGWSPDGITLPGMLDLEAGCSGLSKTDMVAWIKAFSDRYNEKTKRYPMFYVSPSWWSECTGDSNAFAKTNPLVMARWASSPGAAPGGWSSHTIWQNADTYTYGGDSDFFNGDEKALVAFATGK